MSSAPSIQLPIAALRIALGIKSRIIFSKDITINGVPGITSLRLEHARYGRDLIVTHLNGVALEKSASLGEYYGNYLIHGVVNADNSDIKAKRAAAKREQRRNQRPKLVRSKTTGLGWELVDAATDLQMEVSEIDDAGREITTAVDISKFCYRMICPLCQYRIRYAQPNSIHEIRYCRPCQKRERRRLKSKPRRK